MESQSFEEFDKQWRASLTPEQEALRQTVSLELNYVFELLLLGAAIRQAREKAGLSQRDLAKVTGIKQSEISKIERAMVNVTAATEFKIRSVLGIVKRYEVAA